MPAGAMLLAMHPEEPPHADPRINEARRLCREVILLCDQFDEAVKAEKAKGTARKVAESDTPVKRSA